MDLALNNLQRLVCHETQTTNTKKSYKMGVLEKNVLSVTEDDEIHSCH